MGRLAGIAAGIAMIALTLRVTPAMGAGDRFDQLAEQPFVEGAATDSPAKALMEELYFQRACHAYLWSLPAMNCVAMEVGSAKAFGSGYNVMQIWKSALSGSETQIYAVWGCPFRVA
jgi:hypothetical protein